MQPYKSISALKHRNFRLFWTAQMISLTGTWMHQTAQGWLVYKLTDSPFFLGLTGMTASLPILLFTLAGGVVADRFPKRNIILTTQGILMCLALILAILVATGTVSIWYVLVLAFFIGSAHSFEIPARQSFIIEMVGKKDLLNAIALNSSAFHGARMIGPAIAGVLMGLIGLAACFFINSLSFLATIVGLLKMRFKPDEIKTSPKTGAIVELKEGLSYIFHHPEVYTLLILVGITSFFGFPYITFLPVYARDILETGETGLGVLMGFAGAGAFSGAVSLALRGDSSRKGIIMAVSGIIFSLALFVFSMSRNVWLSCAMLFFVGTGAINQIATANSLLQISVPDHLRGRVMSSFTTMFLGMAPLGNLTLGSLAHYAGTQNALTTGAVFCLLGTLIILWKKPEIYRNMGQSPLM
jgi:predicted MFS family arabinose efflux permease